MPNPPRRIIGLLNSSAGAAGRCSPEELRDAVATAFRARGIEADLVLVESGRMGEAVREALARLEAGGAEALAVGGGDGSIGTAAEALAGTGLALGVLPLGTLNHFAKDLAIPPDLEGAVAVIAAGHSRMVDVGEVNGRVFINNSSVGLYPHLVSDRERRQAGNGLSKWGAMALAAVRLLRRFPLRRLTVTAEGRQRTCRSPCVFVGNNAYRFGPGVLGTRERLDGGELCVLVARSQGRLGLFLLAVRSVLGRIKTAKDLDLLTVSSARIDARTSRLLVAHDGEVEVMRTPLRYRTRVGALRVFAPG